MSTEKEGGLGPQDYLCYCILRELDTYQREGRSVTRTQFLKLPCIADHYLYDDHELDIGLPRYWYQYGEIVNEQPLSSSYYNVTPGEWGGHQVQPAPGISSDAFDVSEDVQQHISSVVRRVVSQFANQDSKEVKDFQYKNHAPNSFVRSFDEFREFVLNQDQQNASLADFSQGSVQSMEERGKEYLDELLMEYPADQYSDMYDLFLRWEDTARLLIDDGEFNDIEDLLGDFWETFSKVELRFQHAQNTPKEQKVRWMNERNEEINSFNIRLSEVRKDVLADRETSNIFESVTQSGTPDDLI